MYQFSSLKPAEQKAAELVGITEAFLSRNVAGQRSKKVALFCKSHVLSITYHNHTKMYILIRVGLLPQPR